MKKQMFKEWEGFNLGAWTEEVNTRDFIQKNYTPYEGRDEFLAGPTDATTKLWAKVMEDEKKARAQGGVLDADTDVVSMINSHEPGYIDKNLEKIVGLQTDKLFRRALMPFGGINTAVTANKEYGYEVSDEIKEIFTKYRKTHNQGVFDVYTDEMRNARRSKIITGLPDAYSRGRIIGDYRRAALYGIDFLIKEKMADKARMGKVMTEEVIRAKEEISDQIKAMKELVKMAERHGFDITKPAKNAQEAIQWTYFAYLGAIKDQNGAAMSFGRTATFLDIYIERDLKNGTITEEEAQEMVDHLIMKLRVVRFMRPEAYNEIFTGDPVWATEVVGGMGLDGRTLVTKTAFRYIHTLSNMGPSPEPNLTILWSTRLPQGFKDFCAKYSILFSSMQYENDDIMRTTHGDDYAIACCVSPMKVGKQMQFFGARCNMPKALTYAINGGVDEKSKKQVGPIFAPITGDGPLNYDEVMQKLDVTLDWLVELYVNTLNAIHYMHDKYYYEASEMAYYDSKVERFFATGMAGLSVITDSLSAIKHAKVTPIRDENGIVVDYKTEGDFPKYGNDDDRADDIAKFIVKSFMNKVRSHWTYRESLPTMSILTITSNVMYGKATGSTPDGRKAGVAFAPGANPMHGRDSSGAVASLASVAKLPFQHASDGISNTFSIIPNALGKDGEMKIIHGDLNINLDEGCTGPACDTGDDTKTPASAAKKSK